MCREVHDCALGLSPATIVVITTLSGVKRSGGSFDAFVEYSTECTSWNRSSSVLVFRMPTVEYSVLHPVAECSVQ